MSNKSNSGKAAAAAMTPEQLKDRAMKGVEAKKIKSMMRKAKYEGELNIGDICLEVAVLDNGTRVITSSAIFKALDRPRRGNSRVIGVPAFMDAQNLQKFINQELIDRISKVEYLNINGKNQEGYDATILPLVCDLYLKARETGAITLKNQLETAYKAEVLVRSLAKVGIIALVDEATGYQEVREKNALAKILEAFVAKELQPWLKTFPDEYYKQIFRLYGLSYPPKQAHFRPAFIGTLTNDVVYERLAPELLPELKKEASKLKRKARLHQFLTSEVGHPKLREHLASLVTLMKLSATPEEFKQKVNMIHPKFGNTYEMELTAE